jgi:hypothetical protein
MPLHGGYVVRYVLGAEAMTARERLAYEELYRQVEEDQHGGCFCGRPMNQLAHKIPQSRPMIRKYGKEVIHHRDNVVGVCCLECNDAVSISNHPVLIERLAVEIQRELGKPVVEV